MGRPVVAPPATAASLGACQWRSQLRIALKCRARGKPHAISHLSAFAATSNICFLFSLCSLPLRTAFNVAAPPAHIISSLPTPYPASYVCIYDPSRHHFGRKQLRQGSCAFIGIFHVTYGSEPDLFCRVSLFASFAARPSWASHHLHWASLPK